MSLLHGDDLDPGRYRWYELRIRVLVPEDKHPSNENDWYHYDTTMTKPIGSAGKCPDCGKVTVETEGFPWGQDEYGKPRYCPHCDGAEDVE